MIIYMAGTTGAPKRERAIAQVYASRLFSYWFHKPDGQGKKDLPLFLEEAREMAKRPDAEPYKVGLDSGAYSGWSRGAEIDVNEYAKFCLKRLQDETFDVVFNLDVIGDADATRVNQRILEEQGVPAIPVYHKGTHEDYLKDLLNNYEYIALGGMVSDSGNLLTWLDDIFGRHLVNDNGEAIIKVHGFGVTNVTMIRRYPWYSVDSTSWLAGSIAGRMYCPLVHKSFLMMSRDSLLGAASHYQNLPPEDKERIAEYFAALGRGYTIDELLDDYIARDEANVIFYKNLEKELTENPPMFTQEQHNVFDHKEDGTSDDFNAHMEIQRERARTYRAEKRKERGETEPMFGD